MFFLYVCFLPMIHDQAKKQLLCDAAMMRFSQVPAATWHSNVSNLPVEAAWLVEGDAGISKNWKL